VLLLPVSLSTPAFPHGIKSIPTVAEFSRAAFHPANQRIAAHSQMIKHASSAHTNAAQSAFAACIRKQARALGASLIGFAPADRWQDFDEVPPAYRPRAIWKHTQTVMVLGIPMLLPIVESTPSINYQEMYTTGNILLDQMAYRLSLYLNERGFASIPMPRDGYGSLEILLQKMPACFSHVYAAKYAGLGTIGYSHNLLTPEYGPRVRLVSVFTEANLPATPLQSAELCTGCGLCGKLCPAQAFASHPGQIAANYDAHACTRYHQALVAESRFPCGVCVKVCPIGKDRELYHRRHGVNYVREYKELNAGGKDHPDYAHLIHLRTHGSVLPDDASAASRVQTEDISALGGALGKLRKNTGPHLESTAYSIRKKR
jgi:ferredoxin